MSVYFSGFGLQNEKLLFRPWCDEGAYTVAGFSYGAQQALEYAYTRKTRINLLQLFSPAFFHDKTETFIKAQLHHFKRNRSRYLSTFYENVAYPLEKTILEPFTITPKIEDLETLLRYRWQEEKLKSVCQRGVRVEVYLGGEDRIVNTDEALRFFSAYCDVYRFKDQGHILHGGDSYV